MLNDILLPRGVSVNRWPCVKVIRSYFDLNNFVVVLSRSIPNLDLANRSILVMIRFNWLLLTDFLFCSLESSREKINPIFEFFDRVGDKAVCRLCQFPMSFKGPSYVPKLAKHLKSRPGHENVHSDYLARKEQLNILNQKKCLSLFGSFKIPLH